MALANGIPSTGNRLAYFVLICAPILWGGNFVIGRFIGPEVPGVWLNLLRWVIAAIVLTPFLLRPFWACRQQVWDNMPGLVLLASLGLVGFNTFLYVGLRDASVASAAIAFSTTPFLV